MKKVYNLIHLSDGYMYAVDSEIKGKKGWNYCYFHSKKLQFLNKNLPEYENPTNNKFFQQIVATNNPSLNLPLLP